jgi:hypothetical protein
MKRRDFVTSAVAIPLAVSVGIPTAQAETPINPGLFPYQADIVRRSRTARQTWLCWGQRAGKSVVMAEIAQDRIFTALRSTTPAVVAVVGMFAPAESGVFLHLQQGLKNQPGISVRDSYSKMLPAALERSRFTVRPSESLTGASVLTTAMTPWQFINPNSIQRRWMEDHRVAAVIFDEICWWGMRGCKISVTSTLWRR